LEKGDEKSQLFSKAATGKPTDEAGAFRGGKRDWKSKNGGEETARRKSGKGGSERRDSMSEGRVFELKKRTRQEGTGGGSFHPFSLNRRIEVVEKMTRHVCSAELQRGTRKKKRGS